MCEGVFVSEGMHTVVRYAICVGWIGVFVRKWTVWAV